MISELKTVWITSMFAWESRQAAVTGLMTAIDDYTHTHTLIHTLRHYLSPRKQSLPSWESPWLFHSLITKTKTIKTNGSVIVTNRNDCKWCYSFYCNKNMKYNILPSSELFIAPLIILFNEFELKLFIFRELNSEISTT